MARRLFTRIALALAVFLLGGILQSSDHMPTFAQSDCQTFTETGKMVCGRFLEYWQQNGGLRQQGYPISNEFSEASGSDGKAYTVQYFERAVFEKHPENQPPYDVLVSLLGDFQFKMRYPTGEPTGDGASGVQSQAPSPRKTIGQYFGAMGFSGGTSILIQDSLLSTRLANRTHGDPYYDVLGPDFPGFKTVQYAAGSDLSGNRPVWMLLLDSTGNTVGVFTMIKENGDWKIDYVQPNVLDK